VRTVLCVYACVLCNGDVEEDYFVHSRCTRDNFWYYIILRQGSSRYAYQVNYDRLLYSAIQHLYDRHIYTYIYVPMMLGRKLCQALLGQIYGGVKITDTTCRVSPIQQ